MASGEKQLPNVFESMAAMCKCILLDDLAPKLYERHHHVLEINKSILGVLASKYPPLADAFGASLPLPISEASDCIQQGLIESNLPESEIKWIDDQMTETLKDLLPVMADPDLPPLYSECKWAIEGAFEKR